MRPDTGARPALCQRGARHGRTDTAPAGLRMHDEFGHRRIVPLGRREVEVSDHAVVVGGQQVPGAVASQFPQHLVTDRRDTVVRGGRVDQRANLCLLGTREPGAPLGGGH